MIDLTRILPKLLSANPELAVKLVWARVAGEGLRRHAVPHRLEARKFIVSVADSMWQKQLQSMSTELIFRMNTLLGQGAIDEIVFRINPAAVAQEQKGVADKTPARPAPAPAPTELLFAARSITDQDLRARFIRAAEKCIARRDSRNE